MGHDAKLSKDDISTLLLLGARLSSSIRSKVSTMTVRHYTASAIVFDERLDHVLLVHHNEIGKWIYPGGHIESCESPAAAAMREVEEETGILTEICDKPAFTHPSITVHPAPFIITEVQATDKSIGKHNHIDFVYILRGTSSVITVQLKEVSDARWVPLTNVADLETPPDLPELVVEAARSVRRRW